MIDTLLNKKNPTSAIKKILIVDDDETSNFVAQKLLCNYNMEYEIYSYTNSLEALKYMLLMDDVELPDMIFLDINMPHLNGFEFLEKMKEYGLNEKVQVIMYTSSNSLADQKSAQRYNNVIGYMEKPFSAQAYGRMLDMSPR